LGDFEDSLENTTEIAMFIEMKLNGWLFLLKLNAKERISSDA
jgi:hypothetical protein